MMYLLVLAHITWYKPLVSDDLSPALSNSLRADDNANAALLAAGKGTIWG